MRADYLPDIVPGLLWMQAGCRRDAPAYYYRSADGRWIYQTWGEYRDAVAWLSTAWHDQGLRPGDRVGMLLATTPNWEIAQQAVLVNGAAVVGIDIRASQLETDYILDHANTNWLILPDRTPSRITASHVHRPLRVLELGQRAVRERRRIFTLPRYGVELPPTGAMEALLEQRKPDDVATIIYTSGTTGIPKGVAFTHRQLMVACRAIVQALPELDDQDNTICWLPLTALFQRMLNLVAMARGMRVWFTEDSRRILETVREIAPSVMIGVPRFYEKLHETLQQGQGADWGEWRRRLKYMITGSAPLARSILEDLHRQGVLVLEAYGLTENAVPMAMNRASDHRFGSVGKPLPENEIRVAPDGELLVRGAGVFQGYYREASAAGLFTPDGFYRTGDCGYLDEDGFLYLTGRKGDMFKTSTGHRICPAAVESVYEQSPYIERMLVFGKGQKYLAGLITLDQLQAEQYLNRAGALMPLEQPEATGMIKQLLLAELARLEHHLAPYARVLAVGVLAGPPSAAAGEITKSGKVRRTAMADNHRLLLERLFAAPIPCVLTAWDRQEVEGVRCVAC